MSRYVSRDRAAIAAALVAPLAAAAVPLPFRAHWPNTNVALLLVAVVVAVAATGNRVAGGIAAASAAAWFDFFFTLPYERFTIARPADVQTAVLLFGVGVAVSSRCAGRSPPPEGKRSTCGPKPLPAACAPTSPRPRTTRSGPGHAPKPLTRQASGLKSSARSPTTA